MTLPTREDIERINSERPGDEIYPQIKDKINRVKDEGEEVTARLTDLILKDMIFDLALSNSLDEIGKIATYLAQEKDIEPPEFQGKALMAHFSRISKLQLSLNYAKAIGISDTAYDAILKAEVERLWGDSNAALLKKLLTSQTKTYSSPSSFNVPNGVKKGK